MCDGVLVLFATARLQQNFNVSELAEVKVTLLLECAVLQLELIDLLHEHAVLLPATDVCVHFFD